jgi:cytochrome b subunit of formate dehydrogenase
MTYVAWIVGLIYVLASGLSLPFGILALAISPAKGQTVKRMLLVFIIIAQFCCLVSWPLGYSSHMQ